MEFLKNWVKENPNYQIYDKNCQKFAKDFFMHFFNERVITQTNEIGYYAIVAGAGMFTEFLYLLLVKLAYMY
jgi:hypothetical protein